MGMRMPETCWAVSKRQVINLRSCCILLVDSVESIMMHGLANPKLWWFHPYIHTRISLMGYGREQKRKFCYEKIICTTLPVPLSNKWIPCDHDVFADRELRRVALIGLLVWCHWIPQNAFHARSSQEPSVCHQLTLLYALTNNVSELLDHSLSFYTGLSCLTLRRLMSYIYGAPILDVSRSHTTTQHSR